MAAVQVDAYLDLEASQIQHGVDAIDKAASTWAAKFSTAITEGDITTAAVLASDLDLSGATKTLKKPTLLLSEGLVNYGASQANEGDLSAVTLAPLVDPLVLNVQAYIAASVKTATQAAVASATQMVEQAVAGSNPLALKAEAADLKPLKAAMNSLSINLSAASSRLASYGFLLQAKQNGELIYMLSAVLDSRTSEFCRAIDGKIVPVSVGLDRAITMLNAKTPEEASAQAPWLTITPELLVKLQAAGAQELMEMGVLLPPFHPYCRTILQFVSAKILSTTLDSALTLPGAAAATTSTGLSQSGLITPNTNLAMLGIGAAAAALLIGSDDTSLILPGVEVDTVAAAIEAMENGATDLEVMNKFGLTFMQTRTLRDL